MLHIKFQGHRPFRFSKVFTIYGHSGHLGHVTQTFVCLPHGGSICNLVSNGSLVSGEMLFENVDADIDINTDTNYGR